MICPCCRERAVVKAGTCLACRNHVAFCTSTAREESAGALTLVERVQIIREVDELVAFGRDRAVLMGRDPRVNALATHLTKVDARRKLLTKLAQHAARREPTAERTDAPLVELVNEHGEPLLASRSTP